VFTFGVDPTRRRQLLEGLDDHDQGVRLAATGYRWFGPQRARRALGWPDSRPCAERAHRTPVGQSVRREVEGSLRDSALWEAPETRWSSRTTSAGFLVAAPEEDDCEAAEPRDSYDDREIAEPQAGVMFALLFLCSAPAS